MSALVESMSLSKVSSQSVEQTVLDAISFIEWTPLSDLVERLADETFRSQGHIRQIIRNKLSPEGLVILKRAQRKDKAGRNRSIMLVRREMPAGQQETDKTEDMPTIDIPVPENGHLLTIMELSRKLTDKSREIEDMRVAQAVLKGEFDMLLSQLNEAHKKWNS